MSKALKDLKVGDCIYELRYIFNPPHIVEPRIERHKITEIQSKSYCRKFTWGGNSTFSIPMEVLKDSYYMGLYADLDFLFKEYNEVVLKNVKSFYKTLRGYDIDTKQMQ